VGRIVTVDAGHGSRFVGTKCTVGTLAYRMTALPLKSERELATMANGDFIKSWRAAAQRRSHHEKSET